MTKEKVWEYLNNVERTIHRAEDYLPSQGLENFLASEVDMVLDFIANYVMTHEDKFSSNEPAKAIGNAEHLLLRSKEEGTLFDKEHHLIRDVLVEAKTVMSYFK